MTEEEKKLRAELRDANRLINNLLDHLEWIGWGDSYERECSHDLRQEARTYQARPK